jgi:hypothetical protein
VPDEADRPPEEPDWEPANDTERAMLRAALAGDRREYFRILAGADLYLPQLVGDEPGEQRLITGELFGQTVLPVFTSVEALARQADTAADAYTVTNYPELRHKWPDPSWRLAVNPGLPLDAYVPIEAVAGAATGEVTVPTMAEVLVEAADDQDLSDRMGTGPVEVPSERVDAALLEAARAGDVGAYVAILLDAIVLVPTEREVGDPDEILEPGFPWRAAGTPETPAIEVFTSVEALARAHPDVPPTVEVALPFALAVWPEGYGLSVNPASDSHIDLPAENVPWLLMWEEPS